MLTPTTHDAQRVHRRAFGNRTRAMSRLRPRGQLSTGEVNSQQALTHDVGSADHESEPTKTRRPRHEALQRVNRIAEALLPPLGRATRRKVEGQESNPAARAPRCQVR